jgi:hypothetical protein
MASYSTSNGADMPNEISQLPAPESAKQKLRSRPHIPWMHLGKGGTADDHPLNAPPAAYSGGDAAESARRRFEVSGNAVCMN